MTQAHTSAAFAAPRSAPPLSEKAGEALLALVLKQLDDDQALDVVKARSTVWDRYGSKACRRRIGR
jgi:hypothetical protein